MPPPIQLVSTMHEHDQDLIAALAEGTLPPHEAAVARPEVLACGSCRRELELQQRALAALRTAPRPTLTELERARLRRAVLPDTREAAPAPPHWMARWMPAFAAAAVLVVAVGAAALLRGTGGGDFEAALESTATSEAPAAGAAEEAPPATIETAAVPEAATDANGVPYRATAGVEVVDLGAVTLEEIEEQAADLADSFFSSFDDAPQVTRLQVEVSCRDAIIEDFSDQAEAAVVAIATVEGSSVELVAVTDPEAAGPLIVVVQQDGCSVTATFGP